MIYVANENCFHTFQFATMGMNEPFSMKNYKAKISVEGAFFLHLAFYLSRMFCFYKFALCITLESEQWRFLHVNVM